MASNNTDEGPPPPAGRLARTVRPQEGDPVSRGDREAQGCEAEGGEGDP
jgi:hypothetical protein